ncbi:tyrosine-type recombinase/integrase [Cohnella yongneupensis]|uniref:Tyrosine-type recombinase/integrase n=1 Tax=Cohnella yongneupensis TaxID=425006 RepID=A0ABW0R1S5_9BACL
MDRFENSSNNQPQINNHHHAKTQESFRQNSSFAEKILDVSGIFSLHSDDHDIRKVTREKVENMLYAKQLDQAQKEIPYLGQQAINPWLWENKVQTEILANLLREFLSHAMENAPLVFIKKFEHARKLQILTAKLYGVPSDQIRDEQLLDAKSLQRGIHHLPKDELTSSLFHFLMEKSIQAGLLNEKIPAKKPHKSPPLHPRILSFKMHMEEQGFARKHIRNYVTCVQQLFMWLCANVRVFAATSPDAISILQIQNEHLLMYRTYKLKLIKEGLCSPITFEHSIYAIRSFYGFLRDRYGYNAPLQRFRAISAPRYSPREIPTDEQIDALFQVVKQYARDPILEQLGYRFMLDLGLRLSEVANIKWKDINLGARTIVTHSKGKKAHFLPLSVELKKLLLEVQNYPSATYVMGKTPSIIKRELYENFKLYAMIAAWPFPGGVHLFRHIFITRLAYKKRLPQAIKEVARVKMLNTVGLYIHMANQDEHLISEINKLNYD